MKRIIITLLLVLTACTPVQAAEWFTWDEWDGEWFSWDETNTALHVPLTLLMIADYRQTLWISDNGLKPTGDGDYTYENEGNPILGTRPSRNKVNSYFALSYLVTTGLTYILPPEWSHGFQAGVITIEVFAIGNNYSYGIGVKF